MLFNLRSLTPRQVFLIDGIGALLSALLLYVVQYYKKIFGVPDTMFQLLIPFPVLFACYSLTFSLVKPDKWKILLTIIAICNVLYIVYSLLLVYHNAHLLTLAGFIYFKLEILVILVVIFFEKKYIKHVKTAG